MCQLLESDDAIAILADVKSLRDKVLEAMQGDDIEAAMEMFDEESWSSKGHRTLPAELNTLYMMQRDGRIFARPGVHEVVFLCSSSNRVEGTFCCRAIEKLARIGKAPGLTSSVRLLTNDWDPRNTVCLAKAVDEINQSELAGNMECEFVLTGGYKAVIIALVNKITLKALDLNERQHWTTRIYHLHESSEDLIIIPLKDGDIDIDTAF